MRYIIGLAGLPPSQENPKERRRCRRYALLHHLIMRYVPSSTPTRTITTRVVIFVVPYYLEACDSSDHWPRTPRTRRGDLRSCYTCRMLIDSFLFRVIWVYKHFISTEYVCATIGECHPTNGQCSFVYCACAYYKFGPSAMPFSKRRSSLDKSTLSPL